MRGQLSSEMLILLVLVLALAVMAYSYMNGMVGNVGARLNAQTQSAMVENDPYYCSVDSDCAKFSNLKRCLNSTCSP